MGISRSAVPQTDPDHPTVVSHDHEDDIELLEPKKHMYERIASTDHYAAHGSPHDKHVLSSLAVWKWELLSFSAGAVSLIAIIILLYTYNGRDTSDWKAPFSLNTVVSIFSTIFKGTLALPIAGAMGQLKWIWFSKRPRSLADLSIYEKGGSGAWGPVMLLFRQLRGQRFSSLSSFGAALLLLAFAVGPFSQASLAVGTCHQILSPTVSAPAQVQRVLQSHQGDSVGYGTKLSPAMKIAMYAGIYTMPPNSSVTAQVTCSTGNCTFPSFTTLSMCSSCSDISDRIQRPNNRTWMLVGQGYNSTVFRIDTPGFGSRHVYVNVTTSANVSFPFRKDYEKNRSSLMDFQILAMSCKNEGPCMLDNGPNDTAVAFECRYTPCVRTYSGSVVNHIYQEHETSQQPLYPEIDYLNPQNTLFQLEANATLPNGTIVDCSSSTEKSASHSMEVTTRGSRYEFLALNSTRNFTPKTIYYRPECVYKVNAGETSALQYFMRDFFGGAKLYLAFRDSNSDYPWLDQLWNRGKLNVSSVATFGEGIARSISAQWRRDPQPVGVEDVVGQTQKAQPCFKVRWSYLSFLAMLCVAELLFLIAVLITNYRSPWQGDWKASNVPLLFQDLQLQNPATEQKEADLCRKVASVTALFVPKAGRWHLDRQ
ncbi:hypothetical protein VHEMI01708 [[Torrubiella] hemipterigena]|uniref:Uncharacterized protein n=1 Tax=[Torrubiella] hemipterigena TaxID=1531966 RepID=A0A0A1SMM3_9HYPO|nr:hypothetical protein VHEMI01708 [[Torrubiella] hemipterigena]